MRANIVVMLLATLAASSGAPLNTFAQSPLERLEQQIRQRVEGAEDLEPVPEAASPQPQTRSGGGNAEAGYLGAVIDDRQDRGRGVRIMQVQPGGPADRAGLRRQDLITALGGIRVRQMSEVSDILGEFGPGQSVEVEVLRDGQRQQMRVVLGQRPAAGPRRFQGPEIVPRPPAESIPAPPEPQSPGSQLQRPRTIVSTPPDASRIDRLERRVEELERRVAELERELKQSRRQRNTDSR